MNEPKPGPKPITNVFGFIDEIGLLTTPTEDQIFGLGLLKLENPSHLHRAIIQFKNQTGFHQELKFTNVSTYNLKQYKQLLDIYFAQPNTYFNCRIINKSMLPQDANFKRDYYKTYNLLIAKLITESLDTSEYISVIADDISTPKSDQFETDIKDHVKKRTRRNALFGICRIESHAISEIQMVDILLGTIAYAFKLKYQLVKPNRDNPKFKLLKHLQKHLNIDFLAQSRDYPMRNNRTLIINEYTKIIKKADSAVGKNRQ